MRVYEFLVGLETEPNQKTINHLYEYFGKNGVAPQGVLDVAFGVQSGKAIADCTVEAASFEEALEMVLPKLRKEGLHIVRVEVDETGLAVLQETV